MATTKVQDPGNPMANQVIYGGAEGVSDSNDQNHTWANATAADAAKGPSGLDKISNLAAMIDGQWGQVGCNLQNEFAMCLRMM
jgi:hypothetical protein